jgi:hypothetical protein
MMKTDVPLMKLYRSSTMLATGGHVHAIFTHVEFLPNYAGILADKVADIEAGYGSLDRPEYIAAGSTVWNKGLGVSYPTATNIG